jgi:hypothetical protein
MPQSAFLARRDPGADFIDRPKAQRVPRPIQDRILGVGYTFTVTNEKSTGTRKLRQPSWLTKMPSISDRIRRVNWCDTKRHGRMDCAPAKHGQGHLSALRPMFRPSGYRVTGAPRLDVASRQWKVSGIWAQGVSAHIEHVLVLCCQAIVAAVRALLAALWYVDTQPSACDTQIYVAWFTRSSVQAQQLGSFWRHAALPWSGREPALGCSYGCCVGLWAGCGFGRGRASLPLAESQGCGDRSSVGSRGGSRPMRRGRETAGRRDLRVCVRC